VESGAIAIIWQANASAPVSVLQEPACVSVVWGDALRGAESTRATAADIAHGWGGEVEQGGPSHPTAYDGFYAAVVARDTEVVIGADLLGLFPVYYATAGDVLVAGSSAEAFRAHPLFDDELDVTALIGYLLTGGPFDGRTIVRGVRRLGAGTLLRWQGSGRITEQPHYQLPVGERIDATSLGEQVELYDHVLGGAVRRHVAPHADVDVLLSGGRDSRLLAGYLADVRTPRDTLTLGRAQDHDAACAARVARALGMPHRTCDIPFERFSEYADRSVRVEQLAGGMSTVHTWGALELLGGAGGALLSGYLLEVRQIDPLPQSRAEMLAWTHAHALTPERLLPMLRSEALRRSLRDVVRCIETRYEALTPNATERSWQWLASVYARFHAGAVPWRLSFARWPVLPILDRAVLELMVALPRRSTASRRLQDELLRRRFPHLARLPLDRNSADVRPLVPSLGWHLSAGTQFLFNRLRGTVDQTERRYFARMYDFDNPGWRAIRRAAEPARRSLDEWFVPSALAALVPPPETAAAHTDRINQGFGPKSLVGFMRWCGLRRERAA